ncbi:transposase domain-containing protein [Clostridium faecium]
MVETAKANKLVVEKYLVYLFDNLSKIDIKDIESLESLMPWYDKISENMKIKDKK